MGLVLMVTADSFAGRAAAHVRSLPPVILLDAAGLSASRPGRALLDDVSLTVSSGDRIAIVGLNGSGKTTLLRILAGVLRPRYRRRASRS